MTTPLAARMVGAPPIPKPTDVREKAAAYGVEAIPDDELVALCTGKPLNLSPIEIVGCDAKTLAEMGVSKQRAAEIEAVVELSRRGLKKELGQQRVISHPEDALPFLSDLAHLDREHFVVLLLNARNQVISKEHVSMGSMTATTVHPREVFRPAIFHRAVGVLLAHNHPSGDVSPSQADIDLTRGLVLAGEAIQIRVFDHMVIGFDESRNEVEYLSFQLRGLL